MNVSNALDLLTLQMRRVDLHLILHTLEDRMSRMSDKTSPGWRSLNRVHGNLVLAMLKAEKDINEEEARQ